MNGEDSVNRDSLLETFAAELALVAYRVALRSRTHGTWLDLELALWTALAEKVKTWGQDNGLGTAKRGLTCPGVRQLESNSAIFRSHDHDFVPGFVRATEAPLCDGRDPALRVANRTARSHGPVS